jgi:uncharacterized SAM-binding protein YcdF (DUF218 family)
MASDIMQNMIARRQRWAGLVLVVLVGATSIGVPAIRRPILRTAGWALVVNERVEPADIIVVSSDADGAGVLEAADLVHSGVATRVAVFADPPDAVDREFIRRGVPYEDAAARSVRQLRALGVGTIDQIPRDAAGTEAEASALAHWCDDQRFRSVLVVASSDHTRRLRRMLYRFMKGHQTRVTVRSAHYSQFDPDRWWETRDGIRTEIMELEKLMLDVVRHPIA